MLNDTPIGTVCSFAGQVDPISSPANTIWNQSSCASQRPTEPEAGDSPLNFLESQGWMLCNGRWLSKGTYPELFAVIGTLYGENSGQEAFRIPDYRGLFLRGYDAGAGMDPQADERLGPTGSLPFNVVGSLQCDAFQDHTHNYDIASPAGISSSGTAASVSTGSQATSLSNPPALSGPETRPRNVSVNYIIKFR